MCKPACSTVYLAVLKGLDCRCVCGVCDMVGGVCVDTKRCVCVWGGGRGLRKARQHPNPQVRGLLHRAAGPELGEPRSSNVLGNYLKQ